MAAIPQSGPHRRTGLAVNLRIFPVAGITSHMRFVLLILAFWLLTASGALAQDNATAPATLSAPEAVLLAARVSTTPERARLVLDLSEETEFSVISVDSPNRFAVDVRVARSEVEQPAEAAGEGLIAEWRVEAAGEGRARAVLVLAAPAQILCWPAIWGTC